MKRLEGSGADSSRSGRRASSRAVLARSRRRSRRGTAVPSHGATRTRTSSSPCRYGDRAGPGVSARRKRRRPPPAAAPRGETRPGAHDRQAHERGPLPDCFEAPSSDLVGDDFHAAVADDEARALAVEDDRLRALDVHRRADRHGDRSCGLDAGAASDSTVSAPAIGVVRARPSPRGPSPSLRLHVAAASVSIDAPRILQSAEMVFVSWLPP